jgi:hypothetical protein
MFLSVLPPAHFSLLCEMFFLLAFTIQYVADGAENNFIAGI